MIGLLAALHHRPTALAVWAERGVMIEVEGNCRTPIAAHARMRRRRHDDTHGFSRGARRHAYLRLFESSRGRSPNPSSRRSNGAGSWAGKLIGTAG